MRILALLLALLALPARACDEATDCAVPDGTYRIHLPPEAPVGAILFAHGHGGTAAATMRNAALTALADDLGVALVGLQSFDKGWTLPDAPRAGTRPERDEVAYTLRVERDVTERFGVNPDRMLLAGFSAGGMLVWNAACAAGSAFAAFVPMSGTFWKAPPGSCPTDARIFHFHGTSDTVVPIAGRAIGATVQGDLNDVLAMYRADKNLGPGHAVDVPGLDCTGWDGAEGGATLRSCLHPGGHRFRAAWIGGVWNQVIRPR